MKINENTIISKEFNVQFTPKIETQTKKGYRSDFAFTDLFILDTSTLNFISSDKLSPLKEEYLVQEWRIIMD